MRKKTRFFGFASLFLLIIAGFALMGAGRAMGAQRSMIIAPFNIRVENMSFMSASNNTAYYSDSVSTENEGGGNFSQNSSVSASINNTHGTVTFADNTLPEFTDIDISMVSMDIILKQADYYGVEIVYPSDRDISWGVRNGKLTVSDKTKRGRPLNISLFGGMGALVGAGDDRGYVLVSCPADRIDDISLLAVSGNILLEKYTARSLSASTVSGGVDILDSTAGKIDANSVSGGIFLKNCGTDKISAETVSGPVTLISCEFKDLDLNSVSGGIQYETALAEEKYGVNLSSVSGSLNINGERVSKKSYDKNNSGAPYTLNAETISGSINLKFGR